MTIITNHQPGGQLTAAQLNEIAAAVIAVRDALPGKASPADVTAAIQSVVGAAPAALDTLREIADALAADDAADGALAALVAGKVSTSTVGQPSGVAPLDGSGQVPVALVPATKRNLASSTYNFSPSSTRLFRAAMARALSGGPNAHIAFLGDSTDYGTLGTVSIDQAVPRMVQVNLKARGVPTRGTGMLSGFNLADAYQPGPRDPMVSRTGTVTYFPNVGTNALGCYLGTFGSVVPGTITISTTDPLVDQFTVGYIKHPSGHPAVPVTIDGAAVATVPCQGPSAYGTVTYPVTPGGPHTFTISAPASAGIAMLWFVEARSGGPTGGVRISNLGCSGATTNTPLDNASPGASARDGLAEIKADLLVVNYGINDGVNGNQVPLATYNANLTELVTRQRTTGGVAGNGGDVILRTFTPTGDAPTNRFSPITAAQYLAEIYKVADALDVPVIDVNARWQSYAVSAPAPVSYYADPIHPNGAGYRDVANVITDALRSTGVGL